MRVLIEIKKIVEHNNEFIESEYLYRQTMNTDEIETIIKYINHIKLNSHNHEANRNRK